MKPSKQFPFLRRLGSLLLTLWAVHAIAFLLLHSARGGPFDSDRKLSPEIEQALLEQYHLDEPLIVQYGRTLFQLLQGDLGPSLRYRGTDVIDILAAGAPLSFTLGLLALICAMGIGVPAGLLSASRRGSLYDNCISTSSALLLALPNFVLAGIGISLFSFTLPWLPPALAESPKHFVLPALCLGLPFAAQLARLMRTTTLEVLASPSTRAARARGLSKRRILIDHVLPQSLAPVLSFLGPATAGILTGSLVIERIFALPGLGAHFVQAALNRDYTLALGATLTYTLLLGLTSLCSDWLMARLDPRLKTLS